MRVVVLHGRVPEGASSDELDVLVQVEAVSKALTDLGHDTVAAAFSFDLNGVMESLRTIQPDLVFNIVESVEGLGQFIYLAPAVLDYLKLPYTGSCTEAIFLTSNKLLAKKVLKASGISTPPWFCHDTIRDGSLAAEGPFIIKSVWEHASIGLSEDSVVHVKNRDHLLREMHRRREQLRGNCFAESYVEGREFNLSLLAGESGPEVLPPAEIHFVSYAPGTLRIVDYAAKWNADSFSYQHTPRSFDFPDEDKPLMRRLAAIAKNCWHAFGLRGYARVDFRVDPLGKPWVLEVNANPCISPDSGFVAAAERTGLSYKQIIERIIGDSFPLPPFQCTARPCSGRKKRKS